MKCPRHQVELTPSLLQTHEVDHCPECSGLWISGEAIDALLGSGEKLKLRSLCSARKSDLPCPRDGTLLGTAVIAGVTLDLCPACSGLWLDPGELERLQQRVKVKPGTIGSEKEEADRSAGPLGHGALAAGDLLVMGLLGLFG